MKKILSKLWDWHGMIGKALTIFIIVVAVSAVAGVAFGITKCRQQNEIVYTNIFLNEEFDLHNNYKVTVLSADTKDEITITNKKGDEEQLNGHYVDARIRIVQNEGSTKKPHKFDEDDFKLKGHTGVYLPLNDIGSLIGWDMIDLHWDKKDNGFVTSSADISTQNAVEDYSYVGQTIRPGEEVNFHIFLPISSKACNVETSIIVLEIDFFFAGGFFKQENTGEDIILRNRPENLTAA